GTGLLLIAAGRPTDPMARAGDAALPERCKDFLKTERTKLVAVWGAHEEPGGFVHNVALSGDGKLALTGTGSFDPFGNSLQDGSLALWDVKTGRPLRVFAGVKGAVSAVALSPDGKRALTGQFTFNNQGESASVVLWDATTGKSLHTLKGHTRMVQCCAFAPD